MKLFIFFHKIGRPHIPDAVCTKLIALDKRGIHVIFFFFLHENICFGYSLEVSQGGTSNEYHNIVFVEKLDKYQYFSFEKKRALSGAMKTFINND